MKVFNLGCAQGHAFEGWFASDEAYAEQGERGLLECPLCADRAVRRLPSAPRLNLAGAAPPCATPEQRSVEALWLHAMRHVMERSEDVGERFPEEARRIHHGESPERAIRGRASGDDAQALRDEGIEIQSLVLPESLKRTLQ